MAGLYAPLPTLRRRPRGRLRTDRGRRGLLLLHRSGLSPHTPCQSPGALTHVAACTLARSPIRDPLPEGFSHFVSSITAPVASGGSEIAGWAFHPLERCRPSTAHTPTGHWCWASACFGKLTPTTRAMTVKRCHPACLVLRRRQFAG